MFPHPCPPCPSQTHAHFCSGPYLCFSLPPCAGLPCELVGCWDPRRPLLLGGLGGGEERCGVMRLRFKRHRCGRAGPSGGGGGGGGGERGGGWGRSRAWHRVFASKKHRRGWQEWLGECVGRGGEGRGRGGVRVGVLQPLLGTTRCSC
jgi:hypothetical protein